MAYATDQDLTLRVPEAASVSLAQRTLALADAQVMINPDLYGAKAVPAHAYLAAHYLAASGAFAAAGVGGGDAQVSSMSASGISVSYAVATPASADDPTSSKWGRLYVQISRSVPYQPEGI